MKLRPFELVLVVVFGVLMFVALILLRTYQPPPDQNVTQVGVVSIWGDVPAETFDSVLRKIRETDSGFNSVSYKYVPPEDFDAAFVNALADQKSPDLLFMSQERLVKHRSRLQPLSYDTFPLRDFRSAYIDGAEVFALADGLYGVPVAVDPLVLFWNRDIFARSGLIVAPRTWEEVVANTVPTLTIRDFSRNIKTAGIAMGEYRNIKNAFPIISLLSIQGGSSLVTEAQGTYQVGLNQMPGQAAAAQPFTNAAAFFTNFSNTANTLYSWNRALRLDRDMFLSEDLAMYFGFASEGRDLASKNPNLSFDIAEVPQGETASVRRTYGKFYALIIPKASANKNGAFTVLLRLSASEQAKQISDGLNFAPVSRSLLINGSNDVYGRVAYTSAPYARGWLNPDTTVFGNILMQMLDDINANRRDIGSAANDAVNRTQQAFY
jgi:ABC-type glycerol-3-phosphate transport system substrate-binding protein